MVIRNHDKRACNDNIDYAYSCRNPIGFYQQFRLKQKLNFLLNRNSVSLTNKKILDLGCGDGYWLRYFAELGQSTKYLHGIDTSARSITRAKKINPAIEYTKGSMLGFSVGYKYDFITAFVSFMYLIKNEDRLAAFKTVSKSLKKGGYFLIDEIIYGGMVKDLKRGITTRSYTEKELYDLGKQVGLEPIDKEFLFKNFKDAKENVSTAYLGLELDVKTLLDIEDRMPGEWNNMLMLFRKEK